MKKFIRTSVRKINRHRNEEKIDIFSNTANIIRRISNYYYSGGKPDVFLISTGRSGSTWLMELISTQVAFKSCNEPFNLKSPLVRSNLGIWKWEELYHRNSTDKIKKYIRGFLEGDIYFKDPLPWDKNYRPVSNRIVFKITTGLWDRIDWLCEKFKGNVVFLIRHPIAVSLSHGKPYPRLLPMIKSDYSRHFSSEQLKKSKSILNSGNLLEKGVLNWCLQNYVALQKIKKNCAVISYEQTVLEPRVIINYLAEELSLSDPEVMINQLGVESSSTRRSDAATQEALRNYSQNRMWLVRKWQERVSNSQAKKALRILNFFDIQAYTMNKLPNDHYWIDLNEDSQSD